MKVEIICTKDGSSSLFIPELNETYHSKFGAIQEAKHVFIKHGLELFLDVQKVSILEIGFGTGLNAFITFLEIQKKNIEINYTGIEAYPLDFDIINQLNYVNELSAHTFKHDFLKMHTSDWNLRISISKNFQLTKNKQMVEDIDDICKYNLIYFDAFGFEVQPNLWNDAIFQKMYDALMPNGVLVTYACRTVIKQSMQNVGFKVEKLQGAPGKREMLRARKI